MTSIMLNNTRVIVDQQNKRLKVFEIEGDPASLLPELIALAEQEGLDKIIIFAKESDISSFRLLGFILESKLDGFYNGEDAYIVSKFLTPERQTSHLKQEEDQIITQLHELERTYTKSLPTDLIIRAAVPDDASQIVRIFQEVFASYPTPMHDEEYVRNMMQEHVFIAVVEGKEGIVSVSSADMDVKRANAEITDCATLASERGKGLMYFTIEFIEKQLRKKGITNLFSIARAVSFGMNKVLYHRGYQYRGRLVKNVHISGDWEDMNIWVKKG